MGGLCRTGNWDALETIRIHYPFSNPHQLYSPISANESNDVKREEIAHFPKVEDGNLKVDLDNFLIVESLSLYSEEMPSSPPVLLLVKYASSKSKCWQDMFYSFVSWAAFSKSR